MDSICRNCSRADAPLSDGLCRDCARVSRVCRCEEYRAQRDGLVRAAEAALRPINYDSGSPAQNALRDLLSAAIEAAK